MLAVTIALVGIWGWAAGAFAASERPVDLPTGQAAVPELDAVDTVPGAPGHQGSAADPNAWAVSARSGTAFGGPIRPTVWYQAAAAEHEVSPELLEALHAVESNAAPDGCVRNLQGSGAVGPFQFKPATFARFGVDANHDGHVDICGFSDSLFSAARYLRAIGADTDPTSKASRQALARYGTDVDRVVSLARAYQDRDR